MPMSAPSDYKFVRCPDKGLAQAGSPDLAAGGHPPREGQDLSLGGLSNLEEPLKLAGMGFVLGLGFLLVSLTFGCSPKSPANKAPANVLRVGALPDQDEAALRAAYAPLMDFLSKKLEVPVELTVATSYPDLVDRFEAREIQLARFGAVTYVHANRRCGAEPLVMSDVDTRFTSYFLVPGESPANGLADLKGKSFSFGSALSTSGHYMPQYFMREQQIEPEEFFSDVIYSGAHDATAYLLRDKEVDAGAANSRIIDQMFEDGRLKSGDVRILWETPPYADYVWATSADMNEERRADLLDAFLEILPGTEETDRILQNLGANSHFLPATDGDFAKIRSVVKGQPDGDAGPQE